VAAWTCKGPGILPTGADHDSGLAYLVQVRVSDASNPLLLYAAREYPLPLTLLMTKLLASVITREGGGVPRYFCWLKTSRRKETRREEAPKGGF
jgi:hypothetical protein